MWYGLAIAGVVVLLLLIFAIAGRNDTRRMERLNTGDGGTPASYAGPGGSDPSLSSFSAIDDDWRDPGQNVQDNPAPDQCAVDNGWSDTGDPADCAPDGGSDGGGSDGGGDGGGGGGD